MADNHGYPPPVLESYSAEAAPPALESLVAEAVEEIEQEFKITLHGKNFFERAMMPVIKFGNVVVQKYEITPDGSSIICYLTELPEEGAEISISYAPGIKATLAERFSRSQVTSAGGGVIIQDKSVALFPRLVVGLTAAQVPLGPKPPGNPADGKAADIKVLLDHIHARLKTPDQGAASTERADALRDAWLVQGAQPLPVTFPSGQRIALAEESWARQVSEMLNLAPYGGPGELYFSDASEDHRLIATGIDGRDPGNRVYSLIYACQHLATFGVASRGRSQHTFQPPSPLSGLKGLQLLNAGSSSAFTVQKMMGGLWVIGGGAKPLGPVPDADLNVPQDPRKLGHNPELAKAATLFQITKMQKVQGQGPEFEFGPGTVAVFGNRPALPHGFVTTTQTPTQTPQGLVVVERTDVIFNNGVQERHHIQKNPPFEITSLTWNILQIENNSTGLLRDNSAGAHAGFFIRTDSGAGKFQVFDTGGFGERNRSAGINVVGDISGFHSGTFDGVAEDQISSKESFRGVGVWTKMEDADAKALEKHVEENLKRARPLGLARLVIVRAGKKFTFEDINLFKDKVAPHIIYASPLLRMYDDDDRQNYAISRYVWSLRGANNAGVDISWWIYIPRGPLAKEMLEQPRTTSINDLADGALKHVGGPLTRERLAPNGQVNRALMLAEYAFPIIDVLLDSKGAPRVTYKYPKLGSAARLHMAETVSWDKKIHLPMDKEFLKPGEKSAGFPAYFREAAGGATP